MSYLSELDASGFQQRNTEELLNREEPVEAKPGFFEGSLKGPAAGLMRGGAKAADFLMTFFGKSPSMSDEDERIKDIADQMQDEQVKSAVDLWTPNPKTIGTAGRVLGGLGEMVLPLAAGAGDPALLVGTNTLAAGKQAIDEGVDANTAGVAAAIEGTASYAGLKVPILGKTLASRLATGAGGNLLLGAGSTEAQRLLFERRGYEELAKNYDPLDGEARATDLIAGLVFGGLHHLTVPSERDAVATVNNAKHFQQDTAPGVPADPAARASHQAAMATSTEQLLAGEPVNVREDVTRANFKPRPDAGNPIPEELAALNVAGARVEAPSAGDDQVAGIARGKGLSPEERVIEARFANEVTAHTDELVDAYARLKDSEGGNVINTDIVRELSPDYLADRSKAAAVHEPASFLTKELYRRKLAEAAPGGEVYFLAGGAGSGKSSGRELLGIKDALIYDSTLSKFENATKVIDQALEAKQTAQVVYTFRDPAEAFKNGVLSRSMREERDFKTGRTVPMDAFEQGHRGARETIEKLMEHYKDDPRVRFDIVDNSKGPGEARLAGLDELPPADYNGTREQISDILEEARRSGTVSDAVYRGTRGSAEVAAERVREEVRGEPQPKRPGSSAEAVSDASLDPSVAAAEQLLETNDLQIPTGELDADGNMVTRSAREMMAEADAEIAAAKETGQGIAAAVSCFLTRGA